ncbi:MAG TPA: peroxiredoxin [Thermoleophilaceae bacterium]
MASHPGVGDPAPDFELEGTDGAFRLSDQRGKRVVLLFYPGDETPVCTKQFCSYRDRAEELENLDAVVVGISSGSLDSHNSFREHHGLTVPLLADTDREVANAYGAAAKLVGTRRAVIVIDENGIVRERHVHALGVTYQTVDDIRAMLDKLPAPAAG